MASAVKESNLLSYHDDGSTANLPEKDEKAPLFPRLTRGIRNMWENSSLSSLGSNNNTNKRLSAKSFDDKPKRSPKPTKKFWKLRINSVNTSLPRHRRGQKSQRPDTRKLFEELSLRRIDPQEEMKNVIPLPEGATSTLIHDSDDLSDDDNQTEVDEMEKSYRVDPLTTGVNVFYNSTVTRSPAQPLGEIGESGRFDIKAPIEEAMPSSFRMHAEKDL